MTTVFLTGFPGFLGSALIERLLDRYDEDTTVTCLVQPKYRQQAEDRAAELAGDEDRVEFVEGDLTDETLALTQSTYEDLQEETVEVFHLAAIYDLAVDREPAKAVNIDGTRHMLEFAEDVDNLERFHHVSSVVAAGDYEGRFTEEMLQEGQSFHNYYETTKHMSEVLVQQRMDDIPATVYRPGVAVGDSETGETQKYDGMYAFVEMLADQGDNAVVPAVYGSGAAEFNVVPRDYIVDAIGYLSGIEESEGKVYHLADPNPPTTKELIKTLGDAFGKKRTFVLPVIPKGLTEGVLASLSRFSDEAEEFVKSGGLSYYVWPASFDCSNAVEDLEGSGVECPTFEDYAENLVEFYQENPDIGTEGMR